MATAQLAVSDVITGTNLELEEDLNGECFILGAEGEAEVIIENNIVVFPQGMPAATDQNIGEKVVYTTDQMAAFLVANVHRSIAAGRTPDVAVKVAYLRFLAARNGLVSPSFSTNLHHVRYNHAVFSNHTVAQILATGNDEYNESVIAVRNRLSAEFRKATVPKFTNLVCIVAYMFRIRGHHYMADFQNKYATIWARCLYKPEDLPLDWQFIATDALHAIMPDVLDNFWISAADNARCAGTLIKRIDSAPAGSAGVVALSKGLKDVEMVFPLIPEKVPEAFAEYQTVVKQVQETRWGGSINARFYGSNRLRIDESKIGALASVVLGVYDVLCPNSKLRDSLALKRLAEIAPATGGLIGQAAGRAARDERLNLIGYSVSAAAPGADLV